MTVCEIGATIGRMWRELADTEKQKYNEDFANDKVSCMAVNGRSALCSDVVIIYCS